MYKWITNLIHDCSSCQKNKQWRHDINEAPLERQGELERTPFQIIHMDHKGPSGPYSNRKQSFSLFTSAAINNHWCSRSCCINEELHQTIRNSRKNSTWHRTAFLSIVFCHWTHDFVKNQHLASYLQTFINENKLEKVFLKYLWRKKLPDNDKQMENSKANFVLT